MHMQGLHLFVSKKCILHAQGLGGREGDEQGELPEHVSLIGVSGAAPDDGESTAVRKRLKTGWLGLLPNRGPEPQGTHSR